MHDVAELAIAPRGSLDEIVGRAITWALERVGSTEYALRCLAFVEDAYEIANGIEMFGGDSASESAEEYGARSSVGDAPRGAFVFFDTAGVVNDVLRDWGHVGIALGDGRIVHAWLEVRVDPIEEIGSLPTGGWTPPTLAGWTPPDVFLRDARIV